jgi:hypothetical protein
MKDKISRRDLLATTAALGGTWGMPSMMMAQAAAKAAPPQRAPQAPFVPSEGPNNPMGVGKGIFPGRVVWVHNPEVATWDGVTTPMGVTSATGEWWDDTNCNPEIVDAMFSTAVQGLTGKKTDKEAWLAIFQHFNETRKLGKVGYKPGEKIAIKLNMNNDRAEPTVKPWPSGRGMPSPQMVHAMLRGLVLQAGVPAKDITVFDATDGRYISDTLYKRIVADPALAKITFQVNPKNAGLGREAVQPDMEAPIKFSDPKVGTAYQPKCTTQAKYRISYAMLRAHGICGVTLCTKNNNGTLYWPDNPNFKTKNYWGPAAYHGFIGSTRPLGSYNAFVDLLAYQHIGGKMLLNILDGLYSAAESETNVVRWETMGNHWTSSLLMSQDPVAIESVGLDFIAAEPNEKMRGANPDNFLHEAAQIGNPPSKTKYDPEQNGHVATGSIGVHEHWNNPTDKKYSRNLGKKEGIELVALSAKVGKPAGKS